MKSVHVLLFFAIQVLLGFIFLARYSQFQSVQIYERDYKPCNHNKVVKEKFPFENDEKYDNQGEYFKDVDIKRMDSARKGNLIE